MQIQLLLKFNTICFVFYIHICTTIHLYTSTQYIFHFEEMLHTSWPFTSKFLNNYFVRIGIVSHITTVQIINFRKLNIGTVFKVISNIHILTWSFNSMMSFLIFSPPIQDLVYAQILTFISFSSFLSSETLPKPCFIFYDIDSF